MLSGFVCVLTLLPWLKSAREEDSKHFLRSGLPTWAWALCCLAAPVSYACHPPRPSTEACPAPLPTLWQPFPRRSQEPLLQIVWSAAWGQRRRLAHPGPLCILEDLGYIYLIKIKIKKKSDSLCSGLIVRLKRRKGNANKDRNVASLALGSFLLQT